MKWLLFLSIALVTSRGASAHGVAGDREHEHDAPVQLVVDSKLACRVNIAVKDGHRYISSNGIPNHATGEFPNRNNPNRISEQNYEFRVPAEPTAADRLTRADGRIFGVALNGVVFDPGTAELWRGDRNWRYEALTGGVNLGVDRNNAHVQPSGAYHYHGIPTGLIAELGQSSKQMILVGYAADGFPIYGPSAHADANDAKSDLKKMRSSYRIKRGDRPDGPGGKYDGTFTQDWEYVAGAGDLDECNGRSGVTPDYPDGTYYYVLTDEFPFIPRYWRGTADASFDKRGGPPGGGMNGGAPRGPGGRRPPPPPPG